MGAVALVRAARTGWRATKSASLRKDFAAAKRHGRPSRHSASADLTRLRFVFRALGLHRRTDQETVFLAVALLTLGHRAWLVVGREFAPSGRPARYFSWITVDGEVISTGLAVDELYVPVATLPARSTHD